MFWVFCNICFVKPGQGTKRHFYMTSCSHILCSQCTQPDANVCRRCQEPCMIVQCNSQMPDEVKEVFSDVGEKVPQLMKVLDYQESNRSKLMAHYRSAFHKYNGAKVYVNELEKKFNTLQQKYESAKGAIAELQAAVDALTKKCQWYKQKVGSMTPLMPSPSQRNKSPQIGRRPSPVTTSLQFTPRNGYSYRSQPNAAFCTPESVISSHRSPNSSSSSNSIRGSVSGFTPPSKTLELLSLMNKSRKGHQ